MGAPLTFCCTPVSHTVVSCTQLYHIFRTQVPILSVLHTPTPTPTHTHMHACTHTQPQLMIYTTDSIPTARGNLWANCNSADFLESVLKPSSAGTTTHLWLWPFCGLQIKPRTGRKTTDKDVCIPEGHGSEPWLSPSLYLQRRWVRRMHPKEPLSFGLWVLNPRALSTDRMTHCWREQMFQTY